ncbi:MAG TPA: response regulator transcription factor [Edaphobacter sp.]|nr:response regulator transcription factor [Edaphobacter sp.]
MNAEQRIKVLIVDDHQVVRMGLKTMLESEPDICVIGMASSGTEALDALANLEVDVLLTDLHMTEMGGDALIMQARRSNPKLHAAVLSNYRSDEDIFSAIKAGAMAYILKSALLEQVVRAIRDVHQGKTVIPPHIAEQLAQIVSRNPPSAREAEILQLVALGMNNREIADKLFISRNTVRNHVNSLLEKLGTRDRTEATAVAIKRGLVRVNYD